MEESKEARRIRKLIEKLSESNNTDPDHLALQLSLLNIQHTLNITQNAKRREELLNKKRNLTDPRRRPVIRNVVGDGRCMFRSFALGIHPNLTAEQEKDEADNLRFLVHRIVCGENGARYEKYKRRNVNLQTQQFSEFNNTNNSKRRYCDAIRRPGTYAGLFELRILSQMTRRPVIVYVPVGAKYNVWDVMGSQYKNRNPTIHLWYYKSPDKNRNDGHYQLFTTPPRPSVDLVDIPPKMKTYLNKNRNANTFKPGTPASRPTFRPAS